MKKIQIDDQQKGWKFNKDIGISTGINLLQLVTIVWLGAVFYTQTNERFSFIAEQRKIQNDQMMAFEAQMIKMQETNTQVMLQNGIMGADIKNLSQGVNEIKDALRTKSTK